MFLYIFDILLYYYICQCITFLWPLRFCRLLILSLYKKDYLQFFFKSVSFWLHNCCGWWEGWAPVNRFNHTRWVAENTPTDRPKTVFNRFVIKLFVALFVLSLCPFDISVGVGRAFCHRTESYLFLFVIINLVDAIVIMFNRLTYFMPPGFHRYVQDNNGNLVLHMRGQNIYKPISVR